VKWKNHNLYLRFSRQWVVTPCASEATWHLGGTHRLHLQVRRASQRRNEQWLTLWPWRRGLCVPIPHVHGGATPKTILFITVIWYYAPPWAFRLCKVHSLCACRQYLRVCWIRSDRVLKIKIFGSTACILRFMVLAALPKVTLSYWMSVQVRRRRNLLPPASV
jgi:hypothetical protein